MGGASHKCFKKFGQYRNVAEMESSIKRGGQTHEEDEHSLKSKNRALKYQVDYLQEQLDLIHVELEKKGLKMTVVEEPISQLIVNQEETPQE